MNQILKLRKRKNLTQKQLAKLVHMSEDQLGRRERGEVPLTDDEIRVLSNALIVSIVFRKFNFCRSAAVS